MELLPQSTPYDRPVTGEVIYRDDLRHFPPGEKARPYSQLAPGERRSYEDRAKLFRDAGERPSIMDLYEKYDTALNLSDAECTARTYTESLFALGGEHNPLSLTEIIPWVEPARSLEVILKGDIADIIRSDEQQLALEPSDYYPDIDVRKQNATLMQTTVTAWHWESSKTALLDPEDAQKPYDVLIYPQDEALFLNQLDLSFHYDHPSAGGITETISLLSTQSGRLELSSLVWLSAYAESGYEGHSRQSINTPTDEQVAAFLEAVTTTVGDDPNPVRRFQ